MPGFPARPRWRWRTRVGRRRPSPSRSAPPGARHQPVRSAAYATSSTYLSVAQGLRIDRLADEAQFVVGGQTGLGGPLEAVDLERGGFADLFRRDAGLQAQRPHGLV